MPGPGAPAAAAAGVEVAPGPEALAVAQDRVAEKQFLNANGAPTVAFQAAATPEEAVAAAQAMGAPVLMKTRREGYDGKGQIWVEHPADAAAAFVKLGSVPVILEAPADFVRELSIIAARGRDGATAIYPLSENHHESGILRRTIAPAQVTQALAEQAERIAARVMGGLNYVGVLGIELFELKDGTLLVNGVSKTYAMTGWRIGYAAGPADLISAMETLQSQSTSNACSVSQAAALAALEGDQSFISGFMATYRLRRDTALAKINAIPGLHCRAPGGAFYLFVNCSGLIGRETAQGNELKTDVDVVLYLLNTVGVAMIPGSAYGVAPYFRMSIATSLDVIEEGCRRIASAVSQLR